MENFSITIIPDSTSPELLERILNLKREDEVILFWKDFIKLLPKAEEINWKQETMKL